jgi:hypothetical protein
MIACDDDAAPDPGGGLHVDATHGLPMEKSDVVTRLVPDFLAGGQ